MPLVTFTVTRDASYLNYIDFNSQTGSPSFTMGPDAGTVQLDLPEGTTYTLSGRSDQSSTVLWTQLGNQTVGLEDGGDGDYNDLMVYVNVGEFNSVSGNQVTYTASAVSIFTFTASPTSINYGSGSTLSWTSSGGTNASINNGVGAVGLNSSTTVYPTVTTTYTLTVSNGVGNSTTAQVTVTVSNPPPTINSFSASPLAIRRGNSSTFTWTSSNGNTAVIYPESGDNGIGDVNPNGTFTKFLTQTTTYQLSVWGTGGQAISGYVTVTVYQPGNLTLTLDANSIVAGQSTTLRWSTTGDVNVITWSSGGITNGNVSSNQTVSPTVTTTYTATVSGNGASDTKSITLTVYQIPVVTGFSASPSAIRRGNSSTLSWSTTNATSASINNGIGAVNTNSSTSVSPTITTQYVLSLVGQGGTTGSANTTVTVYQPGNLTLTLDANSIVAGQSTTLRWSTTGDVNVITWSSGGITNGNVSSNQTVSPTVTTTYTATVSGNGASDTKSITLTVYQIPVVTGFSASPSAIRRGVSTRLSWSTTYATSASINNGVGSVTASSGFVDVSPIITTQYVLSLVGQGGTTGSANTIVTVYQPGNITLTLDRPDIVAGQSTTLRWSTTGDVNVITWSSGGITNGNVSSNQTVSPTVTTTYTATVSGNGASDTESVTLTVYQIPVVTGFNADPVAIRRGISTRLSWAITDATSASINNGVGSVTVPSGFVDVSPTITTQYVLSVFGLGNTTGSANTTVTVYQPPTINTFTTSSASIINGNSVTLAWTTSNVTNASINQGIGAVLPNSSRVISPTATTTYRLTVTGLGSDPNVTVYQDVTVIVYQPPVLTLTLDANPIIAGNSTILRWSTTGDASSISWSSGGITNTNLSSNVTVNPTNSITYTATVSGLGGSDTKTVTLLVYQIPTVSLTAPALLEYSAQGTLTYSSSYSNISLSLATTYNYRPNGVPTDVAGPTLSLTRPDSARLGVGTTSVSGTIPTTIPYNSSGPFSVRYILTGVGDGGTVSTPVQLTIVDIDQTPGNITIPESSGLVKSQDPVYGPGLTSSISLRITDIDIPVEIQSNKPIKVEINDNNIWKDLRSI